MHAEPEHRRPQLLRQEAIDARISPDWFRQRRVALASRRLFLHAGASVVACAALLAWFATTRHETLLWRPAVLDAATVGCAQPSARCAVRVRSADANIGEWAPMIRNQRVAVRSGQRTYWVPVTDRAGPPAVGGAAQDGSLVVDWPANVPLPAQASIGVRGPGVRLLARLWPQPGDGGKRDGR